MKGGLEPLALQKQLLQMRLEQYRLEIESDIHTLKNPMRHVAVGGSLLKLIRSHPIIMTGASALIARVPRLGLLIKIAAAGIAAWQVVQLIRSFKR